MGRAWAPNYVCFIIIVLSIMRILTGIILAFVCVQSQAQQNIGAAGESIKTLQGSVSYTVGEIAIQTTETSEGSSAEGVQQAYEIYKVGVEKIIVGGSISVYPNPTNDQLTIKTENVNMSLDFELFDSNGKLVQESTKFLNGHILDMSEVNKAFYFLKISSNSQLIQTFKIIKN